MTVIHERMLAEAGARATLEYIKQEFPAIFAEYTKQRITKPSKIIVPPSAPKKLSHTAKRMVKVWYKKNNINPKTGKPYKLSSEHRAKISADKKKFMSGARAKKHAALMRAAKDINPKTGRPYRVSAKARANMAAAARKRARTAEGRANLVRAQAARHATNNDIATVGSIS